MLDCGCGEVSGAAGGVLGVVAIGGGEGGADAPSFGNSDGGLDGDVAYGGVGGIEEELLPFEYSHLAADASGDDAIEVGVEGGDTFGDGEVELVEIDVVATPGKNMAVGGEDYAGDVFDRAGGAMVAGYPLGCGESESACGDGDVYLSMVELARSVGEIGGNDDGGCLREGGCREEEECGSSKDGAEG